MANLSPPPFINNLTLSDKVTAPWLRWVSALFDQFTTRLYSPKIRATSVGGFESSDGSAGYTGTLTTASLIGKTVTIKDGIITGIV